MYCSIYQNFCSINDNSLCVCLQQYVCVYVLERITQNGLRKCFTFASYIGLSYANQNMQIHSTFDYFWVYFCFFSALIKSFYRSNACVIVLLSIVFVFYHVMYIWTYNNKRFINIKRFEKCHSRSRCQVLEQKIWELRKVRGKKHPNIKPQRVQKIRIWTFGSLVHQINSF